MQQSNSSAGAETLGTVIESRQINADLLRPLLDTTPRFWITVGLLSLVMAWALVAFSYQVTTGMGVAGINQRVMWGVYIVNFVFWIGISHAGTLISAILRVTNAGWRHPITRAAEAITVFALMIGPMFILIHLGRVWLFYWVIPYPSLRDLWPNFRSPLLWDFSCINAYLLGSLTYLYLPMIPDLALARDSLPSGGWRQRLYRLLSLGWVGSTRQWALLEKTIAVMAIIIMPLAISVHTVVSWVFGMTVNPMWHSTIFGPYFVVGAIFSGIAAVIVALYVIRRSLKLERYLEDVHFNNLGLLLLAFCLLWSYFTFAEYLTVYYGHGEHEMPVFLYKISGGMAPYFWTMVACCLLIPLPILAFRRTRTPLGTTVASLFVVVGMWLERFTIVAGTLSHPRLSFMWHEYRPSWVELSIMAGSFAYFILLYVVFSKLFPIVAIWEYKEGRRLLGQRSETAPRSELAPSPSSVTASPAGLEAGT